MTFPDKNRLRQLVQVSGNTKQEKEIINAMISQKIKPTEDFYNLKIGKFN